MLKFLLCYTVRFKVENAILKEKIKVKLLKPLFFSVNSITIHGDYLVMY